MARVFTSFRCLAWVQLPIVGALALAVCTLSFPGQSRGLNNLGTYAQSRAPYPGHIPQRDEQHMANCIREVKRERGRGGILLWAIINITREITSSNYCIGTDRAQL